MWSCGVCLFVMVTNDFPFSSVATIISATVDLSKIASPSLRDLLVKMFRRSVSERLTISQIMQHPWMIGASPRISGDGSSGLLGNHSAMRQVNCRVVRTSEPSSSKDREASESSSGIPSFLVEELSQEDVESDSKKAKFV